MICYAALSGEEYESYRSPNLGDEKTYKAIKMLLSNYPVRINDEERYVLLETDAGGFDIGLVYNDHKFIGTGISFANFTAEMNKIDDKYFDEQFTLFCLSSTIRSFNTRS